MPCLVDSGAMNTLLPGWVADLAGIDCAEAPAKALSVAGAGTKGANGADAADHRRAQLGG